MSETPKPQQLLTLANSLAERLVTQGKFMPFGLLMDEDGADHAITPQEVLEADRDIEDLDAYFDLAKAMVEARDIAAAAVVYGAMVKLSDEAEESPAIVVHIESPGQNATSMIRPFTPSEEGPQWQDGVAVPTNPLLALSNPAEDGEDDQDA